MKCAYCQQEHPEGTLTCPVTGKALDPSLPAELPQEMQANTPAQLNEVERTEPVPAAQVVGDQETPIVPAPLETQDQEVPADVPEPGPPPMAESSPEVVDKPAPPKGRHTVGWVLGGCLGIPLFILLILAFLVLADPFNLHVVGRVNGQYDAAAEVMPADTGMYVGVNFANGWLTRFDKVLTPFFMTEEGTSAANYQPAAANPKYTQQLSPMEELLGQIEEETGIKIPEDITPWVGQYAGVGAVEFEDSGAGLPIPTGFIFAIEARNLARADAFLSALQVNLSNLQDINFEQQTYKRAKIFVTTTYANELGLAFGRSGRMVIIASSLDILKKAIDRQESQALPVEKDYTELINARPRDWTVSLYINRDWMGSYWDSVMANNMSAAGKLINPYTGISPAGILMSVSAIQQGARIDMYVSYDDSAQVKEQVTQAESSYTSPQQVIEMLPKDTLIFLVSNNLNKMVEGMLLASAGYEGESSEIWASFDEILGFSLKDDLVDQLNGPWAIYAVPSTKGLLPATADMNLAISLLVQTGGELDLKPIISGLNSKGVYMGISLEKKERKGFTYYELASYQANEPMLAFGAGNGYFTLGTDGDKLLVAPGEADLLTNSIQYKTAVGALPPAMQPVLYVDLENLLANIREGMSASEREGFNSSMLVIEPIKSITGGAYLLKNNIARSTLVIIMRDE